MRHSVISAMRAAVVFVVHTALATVVSSCIWVFHYIWVFMFGEQEPLIAGVMPLRYLLEIGEAGIIVIFMGFRYVRGDPGISKLSYPGVGVPV